MVKVSNKELDYPGDGLFYYNGHPFTGITVYQSEEGWTQVEEEYKEGLLSGRKREWHGPEALASEAQCALGVRHGLVREWDETGRLEAEHYYDYGVRISGRRWDNDGVLAEEFHIQETDPAFKLIQATRAAQAESEKPN